MESMPLHDTGEAHTTTINPGIDMLSDQEIVCRDSRTHGHQASIIPDAKLADKPFRRDTCLCEMAQHGLGNIPLRLPPRPDLHAKVPVVRLASMRNDLAAVQLKKCAWHALRGFWVVHRGHAHLAGDYAGA